MRVYRHSRELRMLKIHYVELLLLYVYLLRFFASLRLLVFERRFEIVLIEEVLYLNAFTGE